MADRTYYLVDSYGQNMPIKAHDNGDGTWSLTVTPSDVTIPLPLPGGLTGYAEDAPHVSGDIGLPLLAVQQATLGALTAEGDYSPFQIDAQGQLKVSGQGEAMILLASAARGATAGTNGTAFPISTRIAFALLLTFTNKADDVDDTCNVYIDMLVGVSTWVNVVHFTQVLGNAADASAEYASLMPSADVVTLDVSTNAGSGVIRPHVFGSEIRVRWVIVDPTGADASFTFGVQAWAI